MKASRKSYQDAGFDIVGDDGRVTRMDAGRQCLMMNT